MTPPTAVVILAGGLARRMGGGDKCRGLVGGRSLIARTIDVMRPQATALALNANGDPARFDDLGLRVLPDSMPDHPGPLAGILAGLEWAKTEWLVSVPGDCPFLPPDLVARLHRALRDEDADYACAGSGGWTHPVVGLWPVSCGVALRAALQAGERKIDAFTARRRTATATWPVDGIDPFFNVNRPEDRAEADRLAATGHG